MSSRAARGTVALLVTVSALLRFAASRDVVAGWIAPDEAIWSLLGRSLWESGDPSVLGSGGYHTLLYPALVGGPLTLLDLATGVAVVQALQAVLASLTAVVVWAWGRRALGEAWAVVAAALTLAVPGLAYTGLLMREPVRYLVVTLALAALAAVLERPTLGRQSLVLVAVVLAVGTDFQALALLPAVVVAVALACAFERSTLPARRLAPLLGAVVGVPVAVLAAAAALGSAEAVFGAYGAALHGYEVGAVLRDVAWHAGGAFVLVAGIPLLALALMLVECVRRRERDPAASALVATAAAWTLCLLLEIGVFASQWVGHVSERGLLALAPPLFLVLGLWLARGLPRPRGWTQAAALLVAAPAVLLPVSRLAVQEAALDAFGWVPLWRLGEATSTTLVEVVVAGGAALLVAIAVVVPARARSVLPALVAVVLLTLSAVSAREVARLTQLDAAWAFGDAEPGWIDASAEEAVVYLHASGFAAGAWKHVFWNRRVEAVATVPGSAGLAPLVPERVDPEPDGRLALATTATRLVVAPSELELAGEPLATSPASTDLTGLTLWRVEQPVRVLTRREGFQPNGDVQGAAAVTVFGCGAGELRLTLLGKAGAEVLLTANEIPRRRVRVPPGQVWSGSVAAPPDVDGRSPCRFGVSSPGLVGTTVVEWVPAAPAG